MLNGDLYPKGTRLFHIGFETEVEYVCYAGNGIHIVLAPPLDCIDDRVREVKESELSDETVLGLNQLMELDSECLQWIAANQVRVYLDYQKVLKRLKRKNYLPVSVEGEKAFLFYAVFRYEESLLKRKLAPGSRTSQ